MIQKNLSLCSMHSSWLCKWSTHTAMALHLSRNMVLLTSEWLTLECPSRPVTSFSSWVLLISTEIYVKIWERRGKERSLLGSGEKLHYFCCLIHSPCIALHCPELCEYVCYNLFLLTTCLSFLCLPSFACIVFSTTGTCLPWGSDENIIVFWKSSVFCFFS